MPANMSCSSLGLFIVLLTKGNRMLYSYFAEFKDSRLLKGVRWGRDFMYQEVVDLSHLPSEGISIERRVHRSAWQIQERDWESRDDLTFQIFIGGNPAKASVEGKFNAPIRAHCHRCWQEMEVDLSRNFHLTYLAPDPKRFIQEEVELSNEELDMAYLERSQLAIHEMIREQIYLALPMKFLCVQNCRGLCANCGANLNEVECGCAIEQMDPRWASLKVIINEKK
jgi:DUF177 domain-containing protein